MASNYSMPSESDNIDCHLQQVGMGTLICRAARQTGTSTTNEVSEAICFNCDAGKIFREVGCDAALPKIRIYPHIGGASFGVDSLLCRTRRRETTLEYCRSCSLANAESTKAITSTARGLFTAQGFHTAYKDLESARERMRDGKFEAAITSSIACLESTLRECHVRCAQPLPDGKQVTDLWKSARGLLRFDEIGQGDTVETLLNSLAGVVRHVGGLRNSLGDAHGRDSLSPAASEVIAELALNTAATLATAAIRRLNQLLERTT